MSKISELYGATLFEVLLEENKDKAFLENIGFVKSAVARDSELVKVLDAPMITQQEKVDLLDAVFKGNIDTYVLNFLKVMSDRKVASSIEESLVEFEKNYDKHYKIEKVTAITAVPLSDVLAEKLKQKLVKITGKSIVLENKVDESRLGGVILEFSSKQIDSTIASELSAIKQELAKM